MSVNLKAYADTAIDQGKQVLGSTLSTAQAQVADVTGKAAGAVQDLRTQAEKAINLDAVRHAVEPYVSQLKGYTASVSERAEGLYRTVTADPRVAKLVGTAEAVGGAVVLTVQDRVVAPVQQFTGRGRRTTSATPAPTTSTSTTTASTTSASTTSTPAATATAKRATTKPATTKPATTKPATTNPAAKAAAKPAAKSTAGKSTPKPTA